MFNLCKNSLSLSLARIALIFLLGLTLISCGGGGGGGGGTPPLSDADAVAEDRDALEIAFTSGDSADSVTQSLTLPASGSNGTTITWISNAKNINALNGEVFRGKAGEGDITVVLTATITKNSVSETKAFTLTIKEDSIIPTVEITNLHDKAIVETGFVTGISSDNDIVVKVEVSIDGGEYFAATGDTSWKFKLPVGSNTWRDHTAHTISVRSTDKAGNSSSVLSLNVRKGRNKDANGDGFADLIVGSRSAGFVQIYHSISSGGVDAQFTGSYIPVKITGTGTSNLIQPHAFGDINGDGFADLVLSGNSSTYVFLSSGESGITDGDLSSANTVITGGASYKVDMGDMNGDGFADLALRYSDCHIFYSKGTTGLNTSYTLSTDDATISIGYGGQPSVAIGDVNGDGYADIAVGNSEGGGGTYPGMIMVYHSAGSSGIKTNSYVYGVCGDSNQHFGFSMAFGDVNGDGYQDLAVGSSGNSSSSVRIFHSSGSGGIIDTYDTDLSIPVWPDIVSFGDINGDGYQDLVIGQYYYSSYQGRAYIYYSSGNSGLSTSAANTITGEPSAAYFASAIDVVDLNGDGYKDIIIGAPNYDTNAGRIYIFNSKGTTGITLSVSSATDADRIITGAGGNRFGSELGH